MMMAIRLLTGGARGNKEKRKEKGKERNHCRPGQKG
jgi:hypothetical protein